MTMGGKQYLSFRMGGCLFGIDVLLVREVIHHFDLTPVEGAPEYVRGLINLRGQIVPLLDLWERIGSGGRKEVEYTHCVILKTGADMAGASHDLRGAWLPEETAGLVVDGIGGVAACAHDINPPPAHLQGVNGEYIKGVLQLEGGLMMLIEMEKALRFE